MSNQLTVAEKNKAAAALIERMSGQFAKVLPKVLTPERFCRVALSAINKNQALAEALMDPRSQPSVWNSFMRSAEMGLEPDGRRATINCYRRKDGSYDVTLIPMYQGLTELAMRSGLISTIHADKVCENDLFDWNTGEITHKIDFRKPRGDVYAFYCIVRFKDGSVKTETMSLEEVNAIRDLSSSYQGAKKYGKSSSPWITNPEEMGKKTVFRRCSKWLPLSPELRAAVEADDDDYSAPIDIRHAVNDKFAQAAGIVNEEPTAADPDAEIVETSAESVPEPETKKDPANPGSLFSEEK